MMLFLSLAANPAPTSTCLGHLARDRHRALTAYDREHDLNASGASFSCALGLTASDVDSDLQRIANVADRPGCAGLREILFFPFTIAHANRVAKVTERTACSYSRQVKLTLLKSQAQMRSRELQLVGWRGAFFRNGDIWLNTVRSGEGRASLRLISMEAIGPFPKGAITTPQVPPKLAR
jgi:hypothetical protein